MNKIKVLSAAFALLIGLAVSAESVTATAVRAQQRYPWNGKVDIVVKLSGTEADVAKANCIFSAVDSATKKTLPVVHVTPQGTDDGSGTTWTRHYLWDSNADVGEVKIADLELTVEVDLGGVQLWEGGPYWAECNVGASKPEEYGYYFWWGDTVGYKRKGGTWVSSKGVDMSSSPFSSSSCPTYYKSTSTLQSQGYIDSTGNLVTKYDAATAHLGAPWRMPTDSDFAALISNCTTTWTTRNGVYGRLVTGKGAYASKSIFLPAAGYGNDSVLSSPGSHGHYWSSTPSSGGSYSAWYLGFGSGYFDRYYCDSYYGFPVRPLRGFAK